MKHPVTDAAVAVYVDRLRKKIPTTDVFPARMSDCDFTASQREAIHAVRAELKAQQKAAMATFPTPPTPKPAVPKPAPPPAVAAAAPKPKKLTKLQKILSLQNGRCFYCGEVLKREDANLDHINPRSHGGGNGQHNLVACHRSQNTAFKDMSVKEKFAYVLKMAGQFRCPGKQATT